MSDSKVIEPDDELLEFLGGIDEVNDLDDGFSDFLASSDIEKAATEKPRAPPKDPRDKDQKSDE